MMETGGGGTQTFHVILRPLPDIIALESGEYYTCVSWKVDELMQYLSWLSQGHQDSAGFKLTLHDCDLIEYNTSVQQNCFYKGQKSMDLIFAVLW